MADPKIVKIARTYLEALSAHGIDVHSVVLFGSNATGKTDKWSDIDLLVISPLFDGEYPRSLIDRLWRIAARVDSRIEPIPCGTRKWLEDDSLPLIEQVRREGVVIKGASAA